MRTARILSINFDSLSRSTFALKAGTIVQSIHDPGFSAIFPVIQPSQEVVLAAFKKFDQAVKMEDSRSTKALRDAMRADLTSLLVLLALDLEQSAEGDLVKLSRTGYDINRTAGVRTKGSTPTPENLRLAHGLSGQIIARCKAIGGKTIYFGAYTLDPINGPWITISGVTNSQKIVFSGLERGKDYYFRLMAVGPFGDSNWSDIATIMVQ